MGKQPRERSLADNEASATLRQLRVSPQKLNLVAEMIRKKPVWEANDQLTFSKKRIAKDVQKLLISAISNAENNHGLDIDQLYVAEAHVGKSFVMKRFRARARGRGAKIMKPFSRITLILREQEGAF